MSLSRKHESTKTRKNQWFVIRLFAFFRAFALSRFRDRYLYCLAKSFGARYLVRLEAPIDVAGVGHGLVDKGVQLGVVPLECLSRCDRKIGVVRGRFLAGRFGWTDFMIRQ